MGNQFRTAILLSILTVFIIWVGQILGGRQGMIFALMLAAGMNFFSYWFSDKVVLKMYRAKPLDSHQAPELYSLVKDLSERAGLPMPKIFIIPQSTPNAFATGRNPDHAVVAVTEGLLNLMSRKELAGVLAHELAHIKNRDILIGSIAATMAGAIMMLANMARWSALFGMGRGNDEEGGAGIFGLIAMSIIAPAAAMMIQMAISRSREYLADATGARISGSPEGLADALEKLGQYSMHSSLKASPSTAHLFIVNPLSGSSMAKLFSTHPPISDRVSRLRGHISIGPSNPPGRKRSGLDDGRAFWDSLS